MVYSVTFVCCVSAFLAGLTETQQNLQCSEVEVALCQNALNDTYFTPATKERQTTMRLEDFIPLVKVQCSTHSLLFVCLSHLPFCTSYNKVQTLMPCCSVCEDVLKHCFKYFTIIQLPWPKHFNCSYFPRHPAICIKPSTASSSTTSSSTTTPAPSSPSLQATDADFSTFIFFICDFVQKMLYYLTFAFAFICFSVSLPFIVFIAYFFFRWLRIRGRPNGEQHQGEIPLRERFAPLPPVPEQ